MADITTKSRDEQTLRLKDGRALGFAEYGTVNGFPVLEFHGWPSCRFEGKLYDEPGLKLGARVVAIDRPGFGLSTYVKGYRIVDWARDVTEFADALGFEKFAVMGISSGSPYALACARFIPERLKSCAVVAGLPPLKVEGEKIKPAEMIHAPEVQIARLANRVPIAARLGFRYYLRQARKNPVKAREELLKGLPPSDLEVLNAPGAEEDFRRVGDECVRGGVRGPIDSVGLELKPWGFRLQDIDMHVHLWQGDADTLVHPPSVAYMASKLPNHTLHTVPGAGHFAMVGRHGEDVLRSLLAP